MLRDLDASHKSNICGSAVIAILNPSVHKSSASTSVPSVRDRRLAFKRVNNGKSYL